jgi:hypothetical protein
VVGGSDRIEAKSGETMAEQQGGRKRYKDDGSLDIRIKKAVLAKVLASLAEHYEAITTRTAGGKVKHGTMTAILSTPTVQKLGIKRHVLQYEIDKRKKKKQEDEASTATAVPLPTTRRTTNDADDDDDNTTDPQMMLPPTIDPPPTPIDYYSQTTKKKVGRPSHDADKAVQAEALMPPMRSRN